MLINEVRNFSVNAQTRMAGVHQFKADFELLRNIHYSAYILFKATGSWVPVLERVKAHDGLKKVSSRITRTYYRQIFNFVINSISYTRTLSRPMKQIWIWKAFQASIYPLRHFISGNCNNRSNRYLLLYINTFQTVSMIRWVKLFLDRCNKRWEKIFFEEKIQSFFFPIFFFFCNECKRM